MAILSKYSLIKYQYGIDVRKGRQLYGMSGKIIFNGQWLRASSEQIIIVEMNQAISEREADFYLELNDHQHVIRTLGLIENTLDLTIFVQEFAVFNDLGGVLMDNQFHLTEPILVEMFAQIADAMTYVARKKIVHADLGCRNVLVFHIDTNTPKNNLVKLTDFGLARWLDRPPAKDDASVIPRRFCAPEILRDARHSSYTEKSDAYSMAVLMWEALSNGAIPYSSTAKDEDVAQEKLNNVQLNRPSVGNDLLWNLMKRCWEMNRQKRPTFEEIRDTLLAIRPTTALQPSIDVSLHRNEVAYDYELDADVRIRDQLNSGPPAVYAAEWISIAERAIVVIERDERPSDCERSVYTEFKEHRHIIHTFGSVQNDRGLFMFIQERAPYGDLQTLFESGNFNPSPAVLVEIFLQVIDATIDLVGKGLVHGDICCANVLVFDMHPTDPKGNRVKLTNFVSAHWNDSSITDERRLPIPVRYCAPEILRSAGRSNYSEYSDVYSMGVLMCKLGQTGKFPISPQSPAAKCDRGS